ncbi:hypothetical protein EVAR_100859_1 [Eumeta japonica]|uniref:Uncharacterized protein n=1 Tax=Eumeta variegata TaxID=151549 RepID=A0A4C1SDX6_EUMVA|nr:hypothetical protein EVAR_100859_1 [Eumeta japonica]
MVGGKRVNFPLKDSKTVQCYEVMLAFNTGKAQYKMQKSTCNKSPGKALKQLEEKRKACLFISNVVAGKLILIMLIPTTEVDMSVQT